MDGWMDRRTDGWMDGWTDRRRDGQTDGQMDGRIDGQADGQMDGRTDRRTDGWTDRGTDRWTDGWMYGRMGRRTYGRVGGRKDRGTHGRTDAQTHSCTDAWTQGCMETRTHEPTYAWTVTLIQCGLPSLRSSRLLREYSEQEKGTCNICVVQQYYSFFNKSLSSGERDSRFFIYSCSKFELCHQEKETRIPFCVQQHCFLKFQPFSQEEGTRVVSCVHQYFCITFGLCPQVKEIFDILLFNGMFDQDLCFSIRREGLLISFHCCRICFHILFEELFSVLLNLSRCLCVENSYNLHAIIAILLIFLHKYLVFVLHPSSFIYIIDWKTSQCNIS
jgi:hypothetical protein